MYILPWFINSLHCVSFTLLFSLSSFFWTFRESIEDTDTSPLKTSLFSVNKGIVPHNLNIGIKTQEPYHW